MPRTFDNLSALLALDFPTTQARIATAKLSYLLKVVSSDQDLLSQCVFSTITATNIDNLSLVQECKRLEEKWGTTFTTEIIEGHLEGSL